MAGATEALDLDGAHRRLRAGGVPARWTTATSCARAAFEQRPAGCRATGAALRTDHVLPHPVEYERDRSSDAPGGRTSGARALVDEPRDTLRAPRARRGGRPLGRARARARRDEAAAGGIDLAAGALRASWPRGDLAPIDDAGDAVAAAPGDDGGPPTWPDGTFLLRTDAEARRAALAAGARRGDDCRLVPEAQLAA